MIGNYISLFLFFLVVVAIGCVVAVVVALLWWVGFLFTCRVFRSEPTRAMRITSIAAGAFVGVMTSIGVIVYVALIPES